ncbi:hypothetical protein [Lacrimispora sp.]|uniref:hypothetical protein n=1 Tax=Lacrimispora sp. TaxID=2719234 RepID=UPI00289646B4|nr:hypothetical protein [Lacrimispora sp.]
MLKKICPVCDLPVNEANYCPRCRRVVRKPLLWNTEYYLNEKRPSYENSRDVPNPAGPGNQQKRNVQGNQQKGNAHGPARQNSVPQRPVTPRHQEVRKPVAPAAGHNPSTPSQPGQAKKGRNPLAPLAGFITLMVVLNGVPKVIGTVGRFVEENSNNSNYETAVPYDDSGFTELEEEEVKASGESCTGYIHFPVDGRQVAATMEQFFNETNYGYVVEEGAVYSDNYMFEEEDGPISYYETVESFSFEDEETSQLEPGDESYVYQYVDVNYDTATGELHDYISSLKDRESSLAFLEEFLRLVETGAGIPQEESSIPVIMEQAATGEWQEDGAFITEGIFDISLYLTNDGVRIYVSYSNPQVMESQET